jgi:hypothetical protein
MTAVWNTFVDGVQGKFVKPVDIAGVTAQRYDMGKAVGKAVRVSTKPVQVRVKTPATDKPAKRVTMADQVREQIRIAKTTGVDVERVVDWAMTVLGMGRGQANNYVKGNWPKVVA